MRPGDTLNLVYQQKEEERIVVLKHEITEEAMYDTAIVIQFEDDELGLEYGLGGAFGKENE